VPKPADKPAPFDPSHSWAFAAAHLGSSSARQASVTLAWLAAALFTSAGVTLALDASAWTSLAVAGATVGLLLKGLWFNRWLSLGVALDVGVMAAVAAGWPTL
jgi:hypothetical protein